MASVLDDFAYRRAIEIIRQQGGCSRANLRDQLGFKRWPDEFQEVWQNLLDRGVIVKRGRSYVAANLPPAPQPERPVHEVVREEFAAKSQAEKVAISAAMGLMRHCNGAAERRRAAMAARRVKGL
ncbi:hypothetical protein [Thalassospira sp.]|uniref:hypothetical protein n=1 Tax=Thalassospira sp. TaxID=1912094 RepID=UPI003AA9A573